MPNSMTPPPSDEMQEGLNLELRAEHTPDMSHLEALRIKLFIHVSSCLSVDTGRKY
jgi:hypothetical protein